MFHPLHVAWQFSWLVAIISVKLWGFQLNCFVTLQLKFFFPNVTFYWKNFRVLPLYSDYISIYAPCFVHRKICCKCEGHSIPACFGYNSYGSIYVWYITNKSTVLYIACVCACVCVCPVMSDSLRPWTVCSPPSSSVHGIFQARILEWVTISSSRGSSWPRDQTCFSYISCIGRWILHPLRNTRSQLFQHYLLKRPSFAHWITLAPLMKFVLSLLFHWSIHSP